MSIGTISNGESGSSARTKINAALTAVDGLGGAATKNVGTMAGTVAAGDDSRLADARAPTSHASTHTNGTDDIQNATASQKGLATAAQIAKLDGIEAGADVTDAANVAAAGALMVPSLGTGVQTALGVAVGSSGSVLVTDYAADAGSTDAYVATLNPAPAALVVGAHYRFMANTANNGAATIDFSGLGAKNIVKAAGGITTALADNDIRAGQWVDVVYDGTNMQMQSTLGNAASGGIGGTLGATGQVFPMSNGTSGATAQPSPLKYALISGLFDTIGTDSYFLLMSSLSAGNRAYINIGAADSSYGTEFGSGAFGVTWRMGQSWGLSPGVDNTYSIGQALYRILSLNLGPSGMRIGDGTNGPAITASGTSPNENLNLNPSPAGTGVVTVGCPLRLKGYTVGTLPTGTQFDTAAVTDALSPVSLATVVGGGSSVVKVFFNGTNWIVQ